MTRAVGTGAPASDAIFTAVGDAYGDQNLSVILQVLDSRTPEDGEPIFDPIAIALQSTFVEGVEEFTGADIDDVDIMTAVIAQEQGETYNTIVAMIQLDQRSDDPQMEFPEGATVPEFLDGPVMSGREAAFRMILDEEGVFREIETANQGNLNRWDGRMSDEDWGAVLENPENFSAEAVAIATFFDENPDEWLMFDTARDEGVALSALADGEYGMGDGDGTTSFADVQQYVTNTDVFNALVSAVGGEDPLLVDLDNNGRFSEDEFQAALGDLEQMAIERAGEDGQYYSGLAETINFALEADMLAEPDNRSALHKFGSGVYEITSLVPGSPTNYYRMLTEPGELMNDYVSFGKGAGEAVLGLGLFVYDISAMSPTGPGFWIERWRVDGDMSQHRGMQLATALPQMGEAALSLMPGTPQYFEQLEAVRRSGTWDSHAGMNLALTVVDVEGFVDDPSKWAGQFAPDMIITALTGGGGMITRAGTTGARLANASRRLLSSVSTNGLRMTTRTGLRQAGARLRMLPANFRHTRFARTLPQDGSVYMMMPDDGFLINSTRRGDINPNGTLDIIAHGNADVIRLDMPSGERLMNAQEAAAFIRNKPDFDGQPVRLLSCETGAHPNGFAQQLADELGVPVMAPNELALAWPDGRLAAGRMVDDPRTGRRVADLRPEYRFEWHYPAGTRPDVPSLEGTGVVDNLGSPTGNPTDAVAANLTPGTGSGPISPIRARNLNAQPTGPPKRTARNDSDYPNLAADTGENNAAKWMAQHGFDIEQNPTRGGGSLTRQDLIDRGLNPGKNPDYLINGEVFDAITPRPSTSPRNIAGRIEDKLSKGQTRRVVLNLDESNVDLADLRKQFEDYPTTGEYNGVPVNLEEVVFVADGKIVGGWSP